MSAAAEPLGANAKKRLVARRLLHQAGNLVEFWGEMGDEAVDAEFARECLARWLEVLPAGVWDTRLEPVAAPAAATAGT
ncbi:hypothetical protein [Streptomyces sp. H27-C3]|uniref:hypothetical protein n=1 Tax=Streptomyces sp. H27-C3 TaxID=3046305 RepID=UPI0024BBADA7|nr:hypothetical protein [Streptomyces sp. H27-C3]MDJ0465064.1 hypothetical protein [Streptomyces sp. H27-C3]